MIRLWINKRLEAAGKERLFTLPEHQERLEYENARLRERIKDVRRGMLGREAQEAMFRAAGKHLSSVAPPTPESLGRALQAATRDALAVVFGKER